MMFGQAPVGLPQAQALPGMPPPQLQTAPDIQKPKSGMFGSGKVQIDLGRAIAGYLAGIGNHAGAMALRSMDEQRQRQYEASQYQQRHQQELQDQMSLYDYKLAHPAQGDDEYTRALTASGVQPGSPEWAQHMANRAGILENPPRYVMVNGALVQVGGPQSSAPAPTAPVGKLTPIGAGGPAQGPGSFHY